MISDADRDRQREVVERPGEEHRQHDAHDHAEHAADQRVMTASQRMTRLTCLRDVPIARSMPSSRVRSLIESTSVFTMPNSETMIASASSA